MTKTSKEDGIVQVLVDRFVNHRLPAILELEEKVDAGQTLNDIDIDYLEQVLKDAEQNKSLVDRHPEWHKISTQVISLYKKITQRHWRMKRIPEDYLPYRHLQQDSIGNPVDHPAVQPCLDRINGRYATRALHEE